MHARAGHKQIACTPTLFLAFELGGNKWKLGFTPGAAQRPRERQGAAGDFLSTTNS